MANISDIHSYIVPVANANFTAQTYTEVYGGSAGCTMVLNGQLVSIGASSSIDIWVRSVSGGTGCYLLGENQDVYQGSSSIG
mgnify:CR=1 FL=1